MNKYLLLFALMLSACRASTPPIVPPIEPPSAIRVAVTVVDETRATIPGLSCTLLPDESTPLDCDYSSGIQAVFSVPADRNGWGARLILAADGFITVDKRVIIVPDIEEVTLYPDVPLLPRLVVRGQYLQQDNGNRFTVIEATDFNLLARYIKGEDITPILAQRSAVGFNVLRILTAFNVCPNAVGPDGRYCQPMGELKPPEHIEMYAKLPAFLRLLAKYNIYAELVGFAGRWSPTVTEVEMLGHWQALQQAVCSQDNPVLVELANEYDHPANAGVPLDKMNRPRCDIALFSNASATQDATPRLPVWDFATYRPGSGPEWMRKVAHNGMEDVADKYNVPTVANETTRFPDNDSSKEHAFDAAAGAALLSAGAAFHSVSGKNSSLWQGLELELAQAWVAGAKSVPLSCQGGFYRRFDDFTFLRVYMRGTDPACLVRIRY